MCRRLSLAPPIYSMAEQDEKGLVSIRVDVEYFDEDGELQSTSCWGGPCVTDDEAEEDAARRAARKLRDGLLFEVDDFNLDDKKYFESLYTRLSADHSVLKKKYKKLRTDHNLLRRYYIDLLAEKERYVVEQKNLKKGETSYQRSRDVPPGFEI